ncbi:MAG: DUF892 family protein [Methylocystis sp.]|nr:DUF892 family protein [Methylocystis sp.]MBI3275243.1 DUF892 family protein [Methylocystis sp.]
MATANERLMQWLRDAQAMESHAEAMLETLARHIENYPEVKAQTQRVLRETREAAGIVQDAIERRGGDTSTLKDSAAPPGPGEQSLSGSFVGDEAVKRAMTEISSYNILVAAAADAAAGDSETHAVCEDILRQEEAMVEWLKNYLASTTVEYLGREETPGAAVQHRRLPSRKNSRISPGSGRSS